MGAKQPQPIPMLCKVLLYTTKRPGFSTGMGGGVPTPAFVAHECK